MLQKPERNERAVTAGTRTRCSRAGGGDCLRTDTQGPALHTARLPKCGDREVLSGVVASEPGRKSRQQ